MRSKFKSKTSKVRNSDIKIGKISNFLNSPSMQEKSMCLTKASKNLEFFANQIIYKNSPNSKDILFHRLSTIQTEKNFLEPIINEDLSMNILLKEYEKYPIGENSKVKLR